MGRHKDTRLELYSEVLQYCICSKLSTFAIVNIFLNHSQLPSPPSTTLSFTPLYLCFPSHVDRSEERERKSAVCVQEVSVQRSVVSATVRESASADLRERV